MTWEYAVIGLVVGLILGIIIMYPSVRKSHKQKALQQELEQSQQELEKYRQELVNHFARSAELLKSMANDYHQLHQHMVNSSSVLLSDMDDKPTAVENTPTENLNAAPTALEDKEQQPRDYSGQSSGLLRSQHVE